MFQAATFSSIWDSSKSNLTHSSIDNKTLCFPDDKQSGGEQSRAAVVTVQCYSKCLWHYLYTLGFHPYAYCLLVTRELQLLQARHLISTRKNEEERNYPSPFIGKIEGSTKWSLKFLLALNFWSSPTPLNRHLLVSFILAFFLIFSSFSPVWSTLLFSLFSSNDALQLPGAPSGKILCGTTALFHSDKMVPCWWPEGCPPWFMVPGALIYEFGEGRGASYLVTLNHHLFSSCLH